MEEHKKTIELLQKSYRSSQTDAKGTPPLPADLAARVKELTRPEPAKVSLNERVENFFLRLRELQVSSSQLIYSMSAVLILAGVAVVFVTSRPEEPEVFRGKSPVTTQPQYEARLSITNLSPELLSQLTESGLIVEGEYKILSTPQELDSLMNREEFILLDGETKTITIKERSVLFPQTLEVDPFDPDNIADHLLEGLGGIEGLEE